MGVRDEAREAIMEALDSAEPYNESNAREVAEEALNDYIYAELTYTNRVLELWDNSTHEEVSLADHETIMDAIRDSTHYQLREDCAGELKSAVEEYLESLEEDA